ncbi:MAG TPA: V-type ATP synthase subunit A [Streptosporangiaceae bacterium]|nr:V-type ATP synthase subunit A [Streptosporangiaceae bacterium]
MRPVSTGVPAADPADPPGRAGLAVGRVSRVSGPLVEVTGLAGLAMSDIVEVGEHRLPGEVVAISGSRAVVQAYEYTGGLAPGDHARGLGRPLSARLGPQLLGGVFDGLLRPLAGAGAWLDPASRDLDEPAAAGSVGHEPEYGFTPQASDGDELAAGGCLGTLATAGGIGYRVLVPPGAGGTVAGLAPAGRVTAAEVIATVGGEPVPLTSSWPVRLPRPYADRLDGSGPLQTGQRVIDVLFPITRGGTSAVPGGFGTGKTVLLQQITKWCDADVIVYVGCGERGNELADMLTELGELSDPRTGGMLAQRTVVIANTSNMPMMARESSIYSAAAVAEFFRDMGLNVVVVADSTSRWAEALREFSSRNGEMPAEEGYPASLASALAAFYERAGRVTTSGGYEGSITIIGAVSPAGGDMTEPVTAYTQRFVRTLWTLDRELAYARHYPAISWAGSFSRDAAVIGNWHARHGDPDWTARRARLSDLLGEADRAGELAELMGVTALPPRQRMTILAGRLAREGVLQQSAVSAADAYCDQARAAALADLVLAVAGRCHELADQGVDPGLIEEQDFSPVLRAKEDASTPDQVRALGAQVIAGLGALAAAGQDAGARP